MTVFLRVLSFPADKKSVVLKSMVEAYRAGEATRDVIERSLGDFKVLPNRPFAYWIIPKVLEIFGSTTPFEAVHRGARVGLQTSDDNRFVREALNNPRRVTAGVADVV